MTDRLVLRRAELDGTVVDLAIEGSRIVEIGSALAGGDHEVHADGGAVIPGLWDHHIHLLALAAAGISVALGPPAVLDATSLGSTLRAAASSAPAGTWIRAVGYHPSIGVDLDRHRLDQLVGSHPVRVQHRSGAQWILNSLAVDRLGLDHADLAGIERDTAGRPTGRLLGLDGWVREQLGEDRPPDLAPVGRLLAARGVVGVTDATPYESLWDLETLAEARRSGLLPQQVVATGGPGLAAASFPPVLGRGPVKVVLADERFPEFSALCTWIDRAHEAGRPVAVHCVTRASLVLLLAALDVVGARPGDRVEHGAVIPPELFGPMVHAGLTVVTQPNFVAERGDAYHREVEPADQPHLYRCGSLLDAGVPVGGSTDAPFGDADPWRAIQAAVERRTASGAAMGVDEALDPRRALGLFLGAPGDPGGARRRVEPGAPADLCVLTQPLGQVLEAPGEAEVRATVAAGTLIHQG